MVHQTKVNGSAKGLTIDLEKWLVGQAVKTPASHAGNGGSIPPRVTKSSLIECIECLKKSSENENRTREGLSVKKTFQ